MLSLRERGCAPATISLHFRALRQLFKYLVAEAERKDNPMERLTAPKVPETPVAVLSDSDLRKVLGTSSGVSFTHRRDTAILRVFLDTPHPLHTGTIPTLGTGAGAGLYRWDSLLAMRRHHGPNWPDIDRGCPGSESA